MSNEKDKLDFVSPLPGKGNENKAFVFDPRTGQSKVYDFDKPDNQMLRQMADVLLNRLDNPKVLAFLYLDEKNKAMVPPTVREIVDDLVNSRITIEQARERVVNWKESIPA